MKVVSLYSGAGGLDLGFIKAGFNVIWANDYDKNACDSYAKNIGCHIRNGDINSLINQLPKKEEADLVIGGPPCQGFSIAGKMDPNDPRSEHVWTFTNVVAKLEPKAFVMENVKALGQLQKWAPLREALLKRFRDLGYAVNYVVLNATDFNVSQSRERVFFIGFKNNSNLIPDLLKMLKPYKILAPTVRETLSILDKVGTGNNQGICNAKITFAPNPIMRKSPYAGMLFNGAGRPVKIDGYCATLPASMGGNRTPIIDNEELYSNKESWIIKYHSDLMKGAIPKKNEIVPSRLRRLTIQESALLQTFPIDYQFQGSQSSIYRQIGNAVPCNLSFAIAKMVMDCLINEKISNLVSNLNYQLKFENL